MNDRDHSDHQRPREVARDDAARRGAASLAALDARLVAEADAFRPRLSRSHRADVMAAIRSGNLDGGGGLDDDHARGGRLVSFEAFRSRTLWAAAIAAAILVAVFLGTRDGEGGASNGAVPRNADGLVAGGGAGAADERGAPMDEPDESGAQGGSGESSPSGASLQVGERVRELLSLDDAVLVAIADSPLETEARNALEDVRVAASGFVASLPGPLRARFGDR